MNKTNTCAILSFVFSLIGLELPAFIVGLVAVSQINRTGEDGKGFAIAGIVISSLAMFIGVIIALVSMTATIGLATSM